MKTEQISRWLDQWKKYGRYVLAGGILLCAVALVAVLAQEQKAKETLCHGEDAVSGEWQVEFAEFTTTQEEYLCLYETCSKRVSSAEEAVDVASNVVEIIEDTFVDADENEDVATVDVVSQYIEYDTAYFEDLLMVRCVDQSGNIQVIAAWLNREDGNTVELLDQEELDGSYFETVSLKRTAQEEDGPTLISEQAYLECVGSCVTGLLIGDFDEAAVEDHFTTVGREAVLRIGQALGISIRHELSVQMSAAGRSEFGKEMVDRLYLRCQVTKGREIQYINILLKLNSDLKVFDVDLI